MCSPCPISLVADKPDDEKLSMRVLQRSQIDSPDQVARNGEAALQVLFSHDYLLSLVLFDLKLLRVDGLEVLERIRGQERTKLLSEAVLTAPHKAQDTTESDRSEANSCVRKPANGEIFVNVVSLLGLYWALIHEALPGGL